MAAQTSRRRRRRRAAEAHRDAKRRFQATHRMHQKLVHYNYGQFLFDEFDLLNELITFKIKSDLLE